MKFRPRALYFAALLAGCAHPGPAGSARDDPHHPAALSGEWIDLAHTTATDSMFWVLAPNGDDGSLEIRVTDTKVTEKRRHYGRWSLEGALGAADSRLCFVHRPGRQGASCVEFRLERVTVDGRSWRHLFLRRYQGQHSTRDRELVERSG